GCRLVICRSGHPGRSGALARVDGEHVVREQATQSTWARRSPRMAVDKLIGACAVDPPVKHTVVRVLGVNAWLLVEDLPHDGSPCPCRRSLAPTPSPG